MDTPRGAALHKLMKLAYAPQKPQPSWQKKQSLAPGLLFDLTVVVMLLFFAAVNLLS